MAELLLWFFGSVFQFIFYVFLIKNKKSEETQGDPGMNPSIVIGSVGSIHLLYLQTCFLLPQKHTQK